MAIAKVRLRSGESAGEVKLDDAYFAIQPNVAVMHQVVTAQLAARRSGTSSAKTRREVRGGGAKPYRQKGTGNARQGSIRAPQFSGGGIAHGPKPRSYKQKTPKKMVNLALRSALSDRAKEGKVLVVDSWGIESPKTKVAKESLAALGVQGTALIVLPPSEEAAALSFRNLPEVQLIRPSELNAYDVLCNEWVIFTRETLPPSRATIQGPRSRQALPLASEPKSSDTSKGGGLKTLSTSQFIEAIARELRPELSEAQLTHIASELKQYVDRAVESGFDDQMGPKLRRIVAELLSEPS